ncbi:MAG: TolC family protein [Bacteroidetes bacterium]|nr:MAG: TolC family protein [Bacteroidota bacterium]
MKRSLVIALFFIVLQVPVAAQQKLSLQQAIATALEKNISVISAKNSMEIRRSGVLAEYGQLLPNVYAAGTWSRDGRSFEATPLIPSGVSAGGSTVASLNARLSLSNGLSNFSSIDRAKNLAGAEEYNFQQSRQNIALSVQQFYLAVLRNKQLLKVSEDNLTRSKQQLSRIEESNRVGAVAKADLYRQQVQTANDELSLINAQNAFDNSKLDLLYLLSLDVTQQYEFDDDGVMQEVARMDSVYQNESYDYTAIVENALASRPDYQSSLLSRDAASNSLTIAKLGHYPSLSIDGGLGYFMAGTSGFSDFKNSSSWDVALSVRIPIFSGFQTSNAVQTSRLGFELAEQNLEQAKRKVQMDIRSALLDLETARKRYDVSLKNVRSAEEDRRIAEERYNLGANTLLDLLIANANYTSALSTKVSSAYDFLYAKQQFRIAAGRDKY